MRLIAGASTTDFIFNVFWRLFHGYIQFVGPIRKFPDFEVEGKRMRDPMITGKNLNQLKSIILNIKGNFYK